MLGIMSARCGQCGHENNPEYRFCGICGAPLQPAITTREAGTARPPSRVSGPSFLGLGDDHTRDLDYLLEDDPPRGHGRLYLALLLLIASAAVLAWYWRDGNPWTELLRRPQSNTPTVAGSLPPTTPAPAPTPQPVADTAPPQQQPPVATEKTDAAPSATTEPAGGTAPSTIPSGVVKPPEQTVEATDHSQGAEPAAKAQTAPAPVAPPAEEAPEGPEASAPKRTPTAPVAPVAKAVPKPAAGIPPASPEDKLVTDGEKYLYGRGVREDCALAQRNLQIGAQRSNTKAQTLLGAMYATGHCVNRDLPTAYRWFAKALHGDPSNSRVQRDLEVLWKQMTPEERQLAMRSQ